MTRKLTTMVAMMVVVFSLLPALSASAAVTSTAAIQDNVVRFADGSAETFTVAVSHSEGGFLSLEGAVPANAVRFTFPAGLSAPGCVDKDGWNCSAVDTGRSRAVIFTAQAGNLGIQSGDSDSFSFAGTLLAPATRDRDETLQVSASDDGGNSYQDASAASAGALTITTGILQIVDNLTVTVPGPVAERTTQGQTATAVALVRNYGASAVTVAPTLVAGANDTVTNPGNITVPARSTSSASFSILTGGVNGSAVTRTENLRVDAANVNDPETSATATFPGRLTVEETVDFASAVNRFSPRVVPNNETSNFQLTIDKAQLQAVNNFSGTLSFSVGGNPVAGVPSVAISSPTSIARTGTAANNIIVSFDGAAIAVPNLADELRLDATLVLNGTDDNGASVTDTIPLPQALLIDALSPILDLNPITIISPESGQTRANGEDTIRISGTLRQAGDVVRQNADADGNGTQDRSGVLLKVTIPGAADLYLTPTFSGDNFSANLDLTGRSSFDGVVSASGTAFDPAGNESPTDTESIEFDPIAPQLAGTALAIIDPLYDDQPVIQVSFDEQFGNTPPVSGACLPSQWRHEANVIDVLFSDGTDCDPLSGNTQGPDNIRILVTQGRINPENAASVDYIASSGVMGIGNDPATDAAANDALAATRDIISGVRPNAPIIQNLFRDNITGLDQGENDRELMGFDGGVWHTNVPSSTDPVIQLNAENIGPSYEVNIYRNANRTGLVGSTSVNANDNPERKVNLQGQGINICNGACVADTTLYAEYVNLASAGNLASDLTAFTIRYDKVLPALVNAETGGNGVIVTYNENLRFGQDSGGDWFALERNADANRGDANEFHSYGANSVSSVSGRADQRNIDVNLGGNGAFAGADYFKSSGGGNYEDFAGNLQLSQQLIIVG